MWDIYDELIAAVPAELVVNECMIGLYWTLVRSSGIGVSLTMRKEPGRLNLGRIVGMPLRELASNIKSWNNLKAMVGLAAINSVFNTPEHLSGLLGHPLSLQKEANAFSYYMERVRGKKVAVVGHFPVLEELSRVSQLSILERSPNDGDFPDPACEYILAEQDFVFITATALINKTLPRLLELSRNAVTVLVGPSTPLSPVFFKYGVETLAGLVVVEPDGFWQTVQEGGRMDIFEHGGQMVLINKADLLNSIPDEAYNRQD
jgi:uncharacterized protein (DUF4213/DUF364 family)